MYEWYLNKKKALFDNIYEVECLYRERVKLEKLMLAPEEQDKLTERIRQLQEERVLLYKMSEAEATLIKRRFERTGFRMISCEIKSDVLNYDSLWIYLKPANYFRLKNLGNVTRKFDVYDLDLGYEYGHYWVNTIKLQLKQLAFLNMHDYCQKEWKRQHPQPADS